MSGFSFWHALVIALVVAIVFGHRHIPALFGAIGSAIGRRRRPLRKSDDKTIEGTFQRRD